MVQIQQRQCRFRIGLHRRCSGRPNHGSAGCNSAEGFMRYLSRKPNTSHQFFWRLAGKGGEYASESFADPFSCLQRLTSVLQPEQQVKVIEAISSVLQALPPHEALPPVLVRRPSSVSSL